MSSSAAAKSSPSASPSASATGAAPVGAPVAAVPSPAPAQPASRGGKRRVIMLSLLGAFLATGAGWWLMHRGLETTDDAQIDADVVAVPSRASGAVVAVHFKDNQAVEAGALLVELDDAQAKAKLAQAEAELASAKASADAADATAELTERNATAGQSIARASLTGAAVAVTATSDQIAEASANLASATALRDKARLDLDRTKQLVASGAIANAQLESAQANFDSAQAAFESAQARIVTLKSTTTQARARASEASARLGQASDTISAQVAEARARAAAAHARVATNEALRDLAKLDLSYTKIFAPHAGIVSKRSVAQGQLVVAGQSVVMLVPDAHKQGSVWVTGNFKETQLAHMKLGQPATLSIDAFGRELHGHVESFSGATGARFALLPPDNATGNFTKVVQRVPVRVKLDEAPADIMLLPGMSVELTVNTR
ncbi:MAG TPA: HlyD family secretion protein [Polyangiaceae bacterium]|nr:HlyD family secretion protein [Polyangiaceae bacterium]